MLGSFGIRVFADIYQARMSTGIFCSCAETRRRSYSCLLLLRWFGIVENLEVFAGCLEASEILQDGRDRAFLCRIPALTMLGNYLQKHPDLMYVHVWPPKPLLTSILYHIVLLVSNASQQANSDLQYSTIWLPALQLVVLDAGRSHKTQKVCTQDSTISTLEPFKFHTCLWLAIYQQTLTSWQAFWRAFWGCQCTTAWWRWCHATRGRIEPISPFFKRHVYFILIFKSWTGSDIFLFNPAIPCNQDGHPVPKDAPPTPSNTHDKDWTPFSNWITFELGEFLYKEKQMLQCKINKLLELWAASLAEHSGTLPYTLQQQMYDTIDAITVGDVPWQTFSLKYSGKVPDGVTPSWMLADYEIHFHNLHLLAHQQLSNPAFKDGFDPILRRDFDRNDNRVYNNFMPSDWSWKQANMLMQVPNNKGAMIVPLIFGSNHGFSGNWTKQLLPLVYVERRDHKRL